MSDMKVNIMMFGGRRCGKTSIIAAMKRCFSNVLGVNSDLVISIHDPDTMESIDKKNREIRGYFNNKRVGITMDASSGATFEIMDYELSVFLKSKKNSMIGLNMCDYPGEWFIRRGENDNVYAERQKTLSDKMKNSDIIMVAIDTPYLMEHAEGPLPKHTGVFNEGRNYCGILSDMVKNYFENYTDFPKLIMFVPLKCEKYYNNGQMDLVKDRIHVAYKEMFDFVGGENSSKYEIVIAPILTLGKETVEFSRFEREKGKLKIDDITGIPTRGRYIFVNQNASYEPIFCEQPLLYSLAYMLKMYEKQKKWENNQEYFLERWIRSLKEKYGNLASLEDFESQSKVIGSMLKTNGDGYEVSQDPLRFGKI